MNLPASSGHFRKPLGPILAAVVLLFVAAAIYPIARHHNSATRKEPVPLAPEKLDKPDKPEADINLGNALLQQGRTEEAIAQYQETLRLKPDFAEAHYYWAGALSIQGKVDEAIAHYTESLRLKPDYTEAHNDLGNLLARSGRAEEAIAHYTEVLRLKPDYADAHNNLAGALLQQGRVREAIAQYEEALRLSPNYVAALANIVWIRAACQDPAFRDGGKAVELARRGVELTGRRDPAALDALAAALAETGNFDEAVATARHARAWALVVNQARLADEIGERLKLYAAGLPYRMSK